MKASINSNQTKNRSVFATIALAAAMLFASAPATKAQVNESNVSYEHYGHTFNLGLGPGYFGYYLMRSPYFTFNYEIEALRNFTVAPFVGFSSYRSNPQWYGNRMYTYRGTILPIGAKATYYFDEIIDLPYRWDLYAAGSLGFTFIRKRWEPDYTGSVGELPGMRPLFLDLHVGAEYHITDATGIFVDLSTGVSVVGVALHR